MNRWHCLALATFATFAALPARAANWEICTLKVEVREKQSGNRALQTRVIQSRALGQAECPHAGTVLRFRPETADYQSELPRRQWPKPGTTVKVRYRYLDGICKDRGACRIQHYSLVLN